MGISSGIFTTPDSVVTISSENDPTFANCISGWPFQESRCTMAAPLASSLQRFGWPRMQK